jgi:haloacetate dehalogenase
MLLEGFRRRDVTVDGVRIATWTAGDGPPVLLLHGYPQTHVMWHGVAPGLAEDHTVVLADLRGYGDSDLPPGGEDHAGYAKRAMAADQVGAMVELGFERFAVVGHDRGGRVAHRLALDHPERVTALAVLDIVPTHFTLVTADLRLARAYFHWFFLSQAPPLPERMIGADPLAWLEGCLHGWSAGGATFHPEALAAYREAFARPAAVAASCEDYRAAVTVDLDTDEGDRERRVACPVLALWGRDGFVGGRYDPVAAWGQYATDVRGAGLAGGHFLPEESTQETLVALRSFLT